MKRYSTVLLFVFFSVLFSTHELWPKKDTSPIDDPNYKGEWKIDKLGTLGIPDDKEFSDIFFSPDGRIIASIRSDKSIRLWSIEGNLLNTLKGPNTDVFFKCIAFRPDGKIIASGCGDDIVIWDINGKLIKILKGHNDYVKKILFSPHGKIISLGNDENNILIWDKNGKLINTLKGHEKEVNDISVSPDGYLIATCSDDSTIRLWSFDGKLLNTIRNHDDRWVKNINFSPNGKILVSSGAYDGKILLMDIDGKVLYKLKAGVGQPMKIIFSPDGTMFASYTRFNPRDRKICVWSDKGKLLREFIYNDDVYEVAFSHDSKIIAASGGLKTRLWNIDGTLLRDIEGYRNIVFSPASNTFAITAKHTTGRLMGVIELYRISNNLSDGDSAFASGKFEESLNSYYRLSLEHPNSVRPLILCANVKFHQKKYREAMAFLHQAAKLKPNNRQIEGLMQTASLALLNQSLQGGRVVTGAAQKNYTSVFDRFAAALNEKNVNAIDNVADLPELMINAGMVPVSAEDYEKKLDLYLGLVMSKAMAVYYKTSKVSQVVASATCARLDLDNPYMDEKDSVYLKNNAGRWQVVLFTKNLSARGKL